MPPGKRRRSARVDRHVRKAPAPEGRPGFIRIDSVHQGDLDGINSLTTNVMLGRSVPLRKATKG